MNPFKELSFCIENFEQINSLSCIIVAANKNLDNNYPNNDGIDPVSVNETYLFHLSSFQLKLLFKSLHNTINSENGYQIYIQDSNTRSESSDISFGNGIQFDIFRLGIFNPNFILRVNQYSIQYFCMILKNIPSINLIISTELYSKLEDNMQYMDDLDVLISESISLQGDIFGIHGKSIGISKFDNIMISVCCILKLRHVDIEYSNSYDSYKNLNLLVVHENLKVVEHFCDLVIPENLWETKKIDEIIKERSINQQNVKQYFKILGLRCSEVSYLIGKKGCRIKRLKEVTRCDIKIMTQRPGDKNLEMNGNEKIDVQYVRIVSSKQSNVDECLKLIQNELSMLEVKNEALRLHKLRNQSPHTDDVQQVFVVELENTNKQD